MAKQFTEFKTPFAKMTFTPDVPSSALGPNEYNSGKNIETDTRGIRAVFGDQEVLASIPGAAGPAGECIFVTSGYRNNNEYWQIVCVLSSTNQGRWYMLDDSGGITNITPGYGADANAFLSGYSADIEITDCWNGTVLFLNDSVGAPMFLLPDGTELKKYSQYGTTITTTATAGTGTTATLTFATINPKPYAVGDRITVSGVVPVGYNGTYTVTASTTTSVSYLNATTGSQVTAGTIVPEYSWNYNPDWSSVSAGFMRMYSTPNVGSILIAGNLKANVISTGTTEYYPATVQWSQSFGLNSGPTSWAPTITNIANQLEVPLRGPVVDGFPCNGNFYVCSYWDTVVFSPLNFQSTSAPILGVRLANQGRGLLNENCWANADQIIYGLDARDIWVFDGNKFSSLGNQRVKDYFFANLSPTYSGRTFVINNTSKNQIEIYYPDLTSTGWCNKMLAYRYDLDVFQAPRDVNAASHGTEAPIYETNAYNTATRTVFYSRGATASKLVQKDQGTKFIGNVAIDSEFRRDNISLGLEYSQQSLLHRLLPEVVNIDTDGLQIDGVGNVTITVGGTNAVGKAATFKPAVTLAINTEDPWIQVNQNAFRVNSVKVTNSSTTDTWQMTAVNWQFTPTQDAR
jgi:hypothetical protein